MRNHMQYLWYVLRHKWYVFLACCKLDIPWLGIVHDLSKFRPDEWFPYVHFFYSSQAPVRDDTGYYKPTDTGDDAFDFAWLLHQKRNKHHWQWWVLIRDNDNSVVQSTGNQQEVSRCKPNIANGVASSVQLRTSQPIEQASAVSVVGSSAQSTGGNTAPSSALSGARSSESMTRSDTGRTQKDTVAVLESKYKHSGSSFYSIMAAFRQGVLVVVRHISNFFASIILRVAGTSTEKKLAQGQRCIAGLSRMATQTPFGSSVTTAIPHLRIMDTAPIRQGQVMIFPMSDQYRREMLADWRGAGRVQGSPDALAWYLKNQDKMQLHPDTRRWIEEMLGK